MPEKEIFKCPECGNDEFIVTVHYGVSAEWHHIVYTNGDTELTHFGKTYDGDVEDQDDEIECTECGHTVSMPGGGQCQDN